MPPSKQDIIELIQLEAVSQGVDPELALSVARVESKLDPTARGDNGQAHGLFQLHAGAAKDAGLDPATRGEVFNNARGGVRYLKMQLDAEKGNVERALSRYNRGTPTYQGIGDPQYVTKVMTQYEGPKTPVRTALARAGEKALSLITPASAEAATTTPTPRRGAPDYSEEIRQLEALIQQQDAQALPGNPAMQPATAQPSQPVPERVVQPPGTATTPSGAIREAMMTPGAPGVIERAETLGQQQTEPLGVGIAGGMGGAALGASAAARLGRFASAAPRVVARAAQALPVAGEMVGGYLARQFNVARGTEEPGTAGDVLSVAGPPVARALAPVGRAIARNLPGASRVMHAQVGEQLSALPGTMTPTTPAADLYRQVATQNPPIVTRNLWKTSRDIIKTEQALEPAFRNPDVEKMARDLLSLQQQYGANVPMQKLYAHQKRLGEMLEAARSQGKSDYTDLKCLYGAFHDDWDAAVKQGVAGAETLKDAIRTSKKEHAVAELEEMFQPGHAGISTNVEGLTNINGGKLSDAFEKKLRTDKVFRESFTPEELQEVRDIFKTAQQLKRLPPPSGAQYGSGRGLGWASLGAAAGSAIAGAPGAAIGTAAGANVPRLISAAIGTKPGRAMLKRAIQEGGGQLISPASMGALSELVRQGEEGAEDYFTSGRQVPVNPGRIFQQP